MEVSNPVSLSNATIPALGRMKVITSSTSFTAPKTGDYLVYLRGGGAGGYSGAGGATSSANGGEGGRAGIAGAEYWGVLSLTEGDTITVGIGSAGTGGTSPAAGANGNKGGNGGNTYVQQGATTLATANGGTNTTTREAVSGINGTAYGLPGESGLKDSGAYGGIVVAADTAGSAGHAAVDYGGGGGGGSGGGGGPGGGGAGGAGGNGKSGLAIFVW